MSKDTVKYRGKEVKLNYSENGFIKGVAYSFPVQSSTLGVLRQYDKLENRAIERLLRRARHNPSMYDLVAITNIKQSAESLTLNREPGLKLNLEGMALFKKRRLN